MPLFLLFLICVETKSYGVEYFAFDLEFHYYFSDLEDSVTFEYWVPKEYSSIFGWVGIAIQDVQDPMDDFRGDYYIALTSTGLMTDRFATFNGFSKEDKDQGCTTDIVPSYREENNFSVYLWTRLLITGDPCDVDLVIGKPFAVKYALGPVIDGQIEQHSMKYMGYEYFILDTNYSDDNSDERGLFGPWYSERIRPI